MKLLNEKVTEIETFLKNRFTYFQDLRQELDDEIIEEVDLYNNKDKYLKRKDDWQEKYQLPYVYTVVQTLVARTLEALFGHDNYLKIYIENPKLRKIERDIQNWIQNLLDRIELRYRARDFLEDSAVKRTSWLRLKILSDNNSKFDGVGFDILSFFDVWFDLDAKTIEDTDVFIRIKKMFYHLKNNKYINLERLAMTLPVNSVTNMTEEELEEYRAKHSDISYYEKDSESQKHNVELLEWYGEYNMGTDEKPDYKEMIFVLGNREVLIRAEENTVKTRKKHLLFPIRLLRQAGSLVGKGVVELLKELQYELNEVRSLRMENAKTRTRLLFKYKRDAGIDFDELFVGGGNAIGFDDDFNDITAFDVPNLIPELSFVAQDIIQDMQQIVGATDYIMGTSAARGVSDTATGTTKIIEQAMFKFGMMANNVAFDLLEFIKYAIIVYISYNKKQIFLENIDITDFFKQTEEELEYNNNFDLSLKNLAARRDIERAQFINAINIILPMLTQIPGANIKELLKEVMERLEMENVNAILPDMASTMLMSPEQNAMANPQAELTASPVETGQGVEVASPKL